MTAHSDADRVQPRIPMRGAYSRMDELAPARPVYEPYESSAWRIGLRLIADVVFIGGLFAGIPLALAGSPFQVIAIGCLLFGLFLEGVLWVTDAER